MTYFNRDDFACSNQTFGHLIHLLNQAKDRCLEKHLQPYDITTAQFKVLLLMARGNIQNTADLVRTLSIDSGAMTRMLDRLENKELLIRSRSTTDRRQVLLALTPEGRQFAEEIPKIAADALNDLTQALEHSEIDTLHVLLNKMLTVHTPLSATVSED